jgi:hypothetical protein
MALTQELQVARVIKNPERFRYVVCDTDKSVKLPRTVQGTCQEVYHLESNFKYNVNKVLWAFCWCSHVSNFSLAMPFPNSICFRCIGTDEQ